jgi:starch phosphorylase
VKRKNKQRLAALVRQRLCIDLDVEAMLDVHIKRIHEYKRQLLKLLHCVTLYRRVLEGHRPAILPRTVLFAGKAAPGYERAKLIIRLINDVAAAIEQEPKVRERLRVVFLPNYGVGDAERIVAAAELSEQISTAGTEASGTGNMKLGLNGAVTVGTLDGANVEIREAVGPSNIFLFGHRVEQLAELRARGYDPLAARHASAELDAALALVENGHFSPGEPARYRALLDAIVAEGDRFFLFADFAAYLACQDKIETAYRHRREWTKRAIRNVARLGDMSSDRAARQYADEIWNLSPDGN